MKHISTIILCIIFASVSLGQELNYSQNSQFNPEEIMVSDNINIDFKFIDYTNYNRHKEKPTTSVFDAKQKLDSIVCAMNYEDINIWTLTNKHEYSYDQYGNIITTIDFEWNSDINNWIPAHKTDKTFNGFNKPILETRNYWLADSSQWFASEKYEFEYYDNGNIKLEKFNEKDYSSNNWVCKLKTEFNYNINNQILSIIGSTWLNDSSMLITNNAKEFTYNSFGNLDTHTVKRLNLLTLLWGEYNKTIFTYNNSNQDSIILFLQFDYATDSLINNARVENYYNSNGFDKIHMLSYWDKSQNQWLFDSKEESNYDDSGKKIFLIRSLWYNETGWLPINKRQFIYDNNGNLTTYQFFSSADSIDWRLAVEHDYDYDYNYKISECWFPNFESYPIEYNNNMNNKPNDYVFLVGNNGDLHEETKVIYHFSNLNIGISDQKTNEIAVYPNPTNGKLLVLNDTKIKLEKIKIYNQFGQLVMTKNTSLESINLSTLSKGIYIAEFMSQNMRTRIKIIVN